MLREVNGILRQTNLPNESEEYLLKRDELRRAEIDLMRQRERVAELRRQLPQGPAVEDYIFEEVSGKLDAGNAPIQKIRLRQLFYESGSVCGHLSLQVRQKQTKPCPMCSAWIDGFNGVAHHLSRSLDFAIVAAADLAS